MMNGDTSFSG